MSVSDCVSSVGFPSVTSSVLSPSVDLSGDWSASDAYWAALDSCCLLGQAGLLLLVVHHGLLLVLEHHGLLLLVVHHGPLVVVLHGLLLGAAGQEGHHGGQGGGQQLLEPCEERWAGEGLLEGTQVPLSVQTPAVIS